MTAARAARWFGIALLIVVLVASTVYLLVYLYRWEWNRAQISGIFMVTALVVLAVGWLAARLRRIEDRLAQQAAREPRRGPPSWVDAGSEAGEGDDSRDIGTSGAASLVREANRRNARRHFEWLRQPPDRLGVFVPILIGAGALVALLAFAIERVAGAVAGSTVDRRIEEMLAPQLPLGPTRPLEEVAEEIRGPRKTHPIAVGIGIVIAAGLVTGFVLLLRDTTQNRAEPGMADGTTTIELAISQKGELQPAEEVGEALWIACRERLPKSANVEVVGPETALTETTILVDQGMGPLRRRRFFGCLEDATLDRASATITSFRVDRPD